MTMLRDSDAGSAAHPRTFATTQWSVVVAAGHGSSPTCRQALATLCASYWYPLYAYVRRKGHHPAEAQDLTQAFFTDLLERDTLRVADQERGKFRAFLLGSLNHFLAKQWRAANARKRGGGVPPISLDFASGETRYCHEPAHELTPESIFERRWAMTLLENSLNRLRDEYARAGKLKLVETLSAYLGGGDRVPYQDIAAQLEMTEGAVKVATHRMRKRCRELLRDEIGQTVDGPEEIDDELRHLFNVVAS